MPTDQDLQSLVSDGTAYVFFQYAGIRDELLGALYMHMAMDDDEHYSTLGAMTSSEVEQTITDFATSGSNLPVLMRAQLRTAFTTMRKASGHDGGHEGGTPATSVAPQIIHVNTSPVGPAPGEIVAHDMVNLTETVNQTSEMKVRLLTDADIRKYNAQYRETEGWIRRPTEHWQTNS